MALTRTSTAVSFRSLVYRSTDTSEQPQDDCVESSQHIDRYGIGRQDAQSLYVLIPFLALATGPNSSGTVNC